ncbi:MAG: hypothetical protein ACI9LY_000552 [Arenicella sp.]|jgi:hypothetical protein
MAKAVNVLPIKKGLVSIAIITLVPCMAWADKTDDIVNSGLARAKAGASSQKRLMILPKRRIKLFRCIISNERWLKD